MSHEATKPNSYAAHIFYTGNGEGRIVFQFKCGDLLYGVFRPFEKIPSVDMEKFVAAAGMEASARFDEFLKENKVKR